MNNKVSEEWLNKQKEIYTKKVDFNNYKAQFSEKRKKAQEKVKYELASRYNCKNYEELSHIVTDNAYRYVQEILFKLKELKNSIDPVYNVKNRNKYIFTKSINYIKMKEMIINLSYNINYMYLLASEDRMKAFADIYEISDLYCKLMNENYYLGLEIANYKGYDFTEDERQLLNLYNSLYDTYLEYYQKFIDTLPESELKQELEAIPNELTKIENKEIFGKKSLKRKQNK